MVGGTSQPTAESTTGTINKHIREGEVGAGLRVNKEDGTELFDTEKITYGLVKSGYMALVEYWSRRILRSPQLDPNDGSNWTPVNVSSNSTGGDAIYGFTVTNAVSPIAFIVGDGCPTGTKRSGNSVTFLYVGASSATKFYCFDLMTNSTFGAGLKCFDDTGVLTFNSLQPPLDIFTTVTAPGLPSAINGFPNRYPSPYTGGVTTFIGGPPAARQTFSRVTIAIGAGEYAACIPFTRLCGCDQGGPGNDETNGAGEGAGGYSGGVRFMFCIAGGTTTSQRVSTPNASYFDIPSVRPTALVIKTAGLPFPFQ